MEIFFLWRRISAKEYFCKGAMATFAAPIDFRELTMRWKLLVGNIFAVVLVGVLGWMLSRSRAADALITDVDPSVVRSTALLDAVRAQDGDQLADAVEAASRAPEALAVFSGGNESDQREAAFTFCESTSRQVGSSIARRNRPAELVAVLSADGKIIARNSERRLDVGRDVGREFPAVTAALQAPVGRTVRDFIKYGEQGWLEVAVSPIVQNNQIRGGLLVGFVLADSAARSDAQRIGVDIGYLFRDGEACTVQSLSVGQQREKEQLRAWCNSSNLQNLLRARNRLHVTLGDEDYLAMTIPMPGAHTAGSSGAVVLRSISAARAPASDVALPSLLATLLGLLIVLGYNMYLAVYIEKPIEQIEDGLLQIINGNRDHRINVEHPELGGIVYRINQLVAELTGVEEGDGNNS
jgi:HAMP domain-containing protein